MGEYPDDKTLEIIKKYDLFKDDVEVLLELIRSNWRYDDEGGFILKGKEKLKLELHTLGWSGNEDIINALEKTKCFFGFFWVKSVRGGHHYFEITLKTFKELNKKSKDGLRKNNLREN